MEIEAKFLLPDEETLELLTTVPRLSDFELGPPRTLLHMDTYLDTADHRLLAAGWVCRVRRREGEPAVVTVKSRTAGEGGIMRREELDVVLENESLQPEPWPPGPVRETVLALAAGRQLVPLARLWQRRTLRAVTRAGQPALLAVLSLDMVDVESPRGGPPTRSWLEAEVELATGDEQLLARLARVLTEEWGLLPEGRSKVERAIP